MHTGLSASWPFPSLAHLLGRNGQYHPALLPVTVTIYCSGWFSQGFFYHLEQASPWTKDGLLLIFVVSVEYRHAFYLHILYSCFCTCWDRDHVKFYCQKYFTIWPFMERSLSTPGLHACKFLNGKIIYFISLITTLEKQESSKNNFSFMEMKCKGLIGKKFWHSEWQIVGATLSFTGLIQELNNWRIEVKWSKT